MLIRNPFVWLRRIRYRRGYGIHSPYAYNLVTGVLYNPGTYYAYSWLDRLLPPRVRLFHLRSMAVHRLLFRLANHWQPRLIAALDLTPTEWNYLHEGCRKAVIDSAMPKGRADMLLLKHDTPGWETHVDENSLLVVSDLRHNHPLWQSVCDNPLTRITFDLYDVGIAIFNPKLNKKNYTINW